MTIITIIYPAVSVTPLTKIINPCHAPTPSPLATLRTWGSRPLLDATPVSACFTLLFLNGIPTGYASIFRSSSVLDTSIICYCSFLSAIFYLSRLVAAGAFLSRPHYFIIIKNPITAFGGFNFSRIYYSKRNNKKKNKE